MIIVTGTVTAKADTVAEMTRAALEHVHRSRTEPGCVSHDVAIDPENPLRLIFLERWEDTDALKTHFKVPESRAFWRLLQELAAEPGAMHLYEANRIKL